MKNEISLKDYKTIILKILVQIDMICRKHNIEYFLFGGTLLGAVRHKGFIPWDDDIDIAMKKNDYLKLKQIINSGDYGIYFLDIDSNGTSIFPYGKVCDSSTVIVKEASFKIPHKYGAFVDVFPLFYYPDNEKDRIRFHKKIRRRRSFIEHCSRTRPEFDASFPRIFIRLFAFLFTRFFNTKKLINNLIKITEKYSESNWIGTLACAYPKKVFSGHIEVLFENHYFFAPIDYNLALEMQYGDYMKLPPIEKQISKHNIVCLYK